MFVVKPFSVSISARFKPIVPLGILLALPRRGVLVSGVITRHQPMAFLCASQVSRNTPLSRFEGMWRRDFGNVKKRLFGATLGCCANTHTDRRGRHTPVARVVAGSSTTATSPHIGLLTIAVAQLYTCRHEPLFGKSPNAAAFLHRPHFSHPHCRKAAFTFSFMTATYRIFPSWFTE